MIITNLKGIALELETDQSVFSPRAPDRGTVAMLEQVEFAKTDKVLDLGCGYGLVGIVAAKMIGEKNVVMCDISEEAIRLSEINAVKNRVSDIRIVRSDGLTGIQDHDFSLILSNPPYHSDFSIAKHFIEDSYRKLVSGGKLYMVTKRKTWYKNKLIHVFGGVHITESDGYFVFCAQKRSSDPVYPTKSDKKDVTKLSKKLSRKVSRKRRART